MLEHFHVWKNTKKNKNFSKFKNHSSGVWWLERWVFHKGSFSSSTWPGKRAVDLFNSSSSYSSESEISISMSSSSDFVGEYETMGLCLTTPFVKFWIESSFAGSIFSSWIRWGSKFASNLTSGSDFIASGFFSGDSEWPLITALKRFYLLFRRFFELYLRKTVFLFRLYLIEGSLCNLSQVFTDV